MTCRAGFGTGPSARETPPPHTYPEFFVKNSQPMILDARAAVERLAAYLRGEALDWEQLADLACEVDALCTSLADRLMPDDLPGGRLLLLEDGVVLVPDAVTPDQLN